MSSVTVPTQYVVGVGIALVSTLISATGLTLQKLTHKRLGRLSTTRGAAPSSSFSGALPTGDAPPTATVTATDLDSDGRPARPYWKQWTWAGGVACMLVSSLMSLAVFAMLGQARSSALAAMTIVWSALLARSFLGESFTSVDAISTVLIILGALISVIFGASGAAAQADNIDELVASLHRTTVVVASVLVTLLYACAHVFTRYSRGRALAGTRSDGLRRAECLTRIGCAALFSGTTGMLSKDVVVSFAQMARDRSPYVLTRPEFYLFLVSLPASLCLQLFYLNSALKEMRQLEAVPLYQCGIIIVGVSWGYLFSSEAAGMRLYSLLLFIGGALISCVGVILLLLKRRLLRRVRKIRAALGRSKAPATSPRSPLPSGEGGAVEGMAVASPKARVSPSPFDRGAPSPRYPRPSSVLTTTTTTSRLGRSRTASGVRAGTEGEEIALDGTARDLTVGLAGADTLVQPHQMHADEPPPSVAAAAEPVPAEPQWSPRPIRVTAVHGRATAGAVAGRARGETASAIALSVPASESHRPRTMSMRARADTLTAQLTRSIRGMTTEDIVTGSARLLGTLAFAPLPSAPSADEEQAPGDEFRFVEDEDDDDEEEDNEAGDDNGGIERRGDAATGGGAEDGSSSSSTVTGDRVTLPGSRDRGRSRSRSPARAEVQQRVVPIG